MNDTLGSMPSGLYIDLDDDSLAPEYLTMSQFDLNMQQQAQSSLHQNWQDLDMFLPQVDGLFYNTSLTPPSSDPTSNNFMTQQQPTTKPSDTASTTPVVASQWGFGFDTNNLKNEYPSPDNLVYSPESESSTSQQQTIVPDLITNENPSPSPDPSNTVQQQQQQQPPAAAPVPAQATPPPPLPQQQQQQQPIIAQMKPETVSPPTISAQIPWNVTIHPASIDQIGKMPIQRLKPQNSTSASATANLPPPPKQQKKSAHNAIERRYRNNINDRIAELKNVVPALLHAKLKDSRTGKRSHKSIDDDDDDGEDGEEYLDGVAVATKLNKATILRKATEYITHLKKTGDDMRQENLLLQQLLSQLPGGEDVLAQYRAQREQREQEMHRQRMLERQQQQQNKQRKMSRKRSRQSEDEMSSSSRPSTPPGSTIGNRIFMAIFAGLTYFSSSPLTAGPSTANQYENHHHISRASSGSDGSIPSPTPSNVTTAPSVMQSILSFSNAWSLLRTIIFLILIFQVFAPFAKMSFKVKRVGRGRRTYRRLRSLRQSKLASSLPFARVAPGDQKCMRIYDIVCRSLETNDDGPPGSGLSIFFRLMKEVSTLFIRHWLGYQLTREDNRLVPEDEWEQACRWLKLNESECLGGNPESTGWTLMHSCARMLNLVEALDDEEHEFASDLRARAYAAAAMQMSLICPINVISNQISLYFWQLAAYEANADVDSVSSNYLKALLWTPQTNLSLDECLEDLLESDAWKEAQSLLKYQVYGQMDNASTVSLSFTAPVLVPVAMLSTLHLLDTLRDQFIVLLGNICENSAVAKTHFESIIALTRLDDENQRLAHWLAAIGLTVQTLWMAEDFSEAEKWISTVLKRMPRSATASHTALDVVERKAKLNHTDELTKTSMVHTLAGATLIKKGNLQEGTSQLQLAGQARASIKKLKRESQNIEEVVTTLADFVVALVGLEAWISAWKKSGEGRDQVRAVTLNLRRMIRLPSLENLSSSGIMISRLSRLGRFVATQPDEADSACECTDDEEDIMSDVDSLDIGGDLRQADKALDILHGRS